MAYFDFSASDNRTFIPMSRHSTQIKQKSCLVDRNRVSTIQCAALDKYNSIMSDKEAKRGKLS